MANSQLRTEPVLSEVEGNYWQLTTVICRLSSVICLLPSVLCLPSSTTVEESLQINLFMQNKAKYLDDQMNVSPVTTKDYENKTLGEHGKKQSQTNPNKAKFKKAKMNVTSILTVGYENKSPIRAPKKQSQTSKRQKPMQTSLPKGIMKKTALSGPEKTNPIQTQSRNNSRAPMIAIGFDLFSGHNYHEVVPNFYLSFCTLIFGTPVRSVCIHI